MNTCSCGVYTMHSVSFIYLFYVIFVRLSGFFLTQKRYKRNVYNCSITNLCKRQCSLLTSSFKHTQAENSVFFLLWLRRHLQNFIDKMLTKYFFFHSDNHVLRNNVSLLLWWSYSWIKAFYKIQKREWRKVISNYNLEKVFSLRWNSNGRKMNSNFRNW